MDEERMSDQLLNNGSPTKEADVRLRWDESNAVTLRPTVAQVTANRQEVRLLLGNRLPSDRDEIGTSFDQCVVLSPFVAKRMLQMLKNAIQRYEPVSGSPGKGSTPDAQGETRGLLPLPPFRFPETVKRVASLFRLLKDFQLLIAYERSFKISHKTLHGGRFLVGIRKSAICENAEAKILRLCDAMGMPPNLRSRFRTDLDMAKTVGFGLGESESTCIAKAYLEFDDQGNGRSKHEVDNLHSYLSHLGFKWDAVDASRCVIASYRCFPYLSMEKVQQKILSDFSACSPGVSRIVSDMVRMAAGKKAADKILYTEVKEEGSSRSSFDINLYAANLLMSDLYPFFLEMCDRYSVPSDEFDAVYKPVQNQVFGHLAGGTDRNGKDFLTCYFSN